MRDEAIRPKCAEDEHERREGDPLYCKRCGWAVCYGCGRAFDLVCDACDDPNE